MPLEREPPTTPPDAPVFETRLRVRYPEVDPQGVVHHGVYLHYFEAGRTELLRELGMPYRALEEEGVRLMVTECRLQYLAPAGYDDLLIVRTRVDEVSRVRLFISYEIQREANGAVVCRGATTLANVDARGRPSPLPAKVAAGLARRS